jgi:hypothetical protein
MNDRQRLEAIMAVVCRYLPPDGISREEAMSQIISLVDPLPEQEQWDTSDMAHRSGGLSVEQEKLCKYCGGIGRVVCDGRCMPEQEPKAWIYEGNLHIFDPTDWAIEPESVQPLYTAPPKREWVGLTDKELEEIQYARDTEVEYVTYDEGEDRFEIDIFPENFARAIEAKLKEKNT